MGSVRNLPPIEISLSGGLRTNFRPEEGAKASLLQAQNVDTFDEFNTLGKIPGSTRVSAQHPASVKSLHYFEYSALEGPRTREALSLSNGNLYRINADLSLTQLTSGLVSEPLCAVTLLDRIHFSSRSQIALTTGGIKYDGVNVRTWGIVAPGQRIVVKQAIDAHTDFTGSADVTKSTDSTTKKDTVASVRVDKTGTSATEAYIERTGLTMDISDGDNLLFVWLFIPGGALQKLATSGTAVEIRYGSSALTNSDSHFFSVGELVQGWNLLSMDRTARDSSTGTGATLSSINTIRFRLVFSSSAQTQAGFRWDRFYGTDKSAPSAAVGSAGNISATVRYRVTYLTENGLESNAGNASASVAPSSQRVNLTAIPVSQDAQVIARRIYRDKNLDSLYKFVDQLDDNTTTSFTDNVADSSLGTSEPPLAGDEFLDNSPPEPFRDADVYNNRVWAISALDGFTLIPSNIGQPEGFPIVEQLQFEEELVGVESHALGLIIYATDKVFLLTGGTADTPVLVVEATNQSGANGFRAKARVKGTNVTVRGPEVVFLASPFDPWHINFDVMDQFQALSQAELQNMHVVHDRSRFRVIFFAKTTTTYDIAFVFQYGTSGRFEISGQGPGVDPQDLRQGTWKTLVLPPSIDPQCSEMVERVADRPDLWIGGADGYVYWLGDPSSANFAKQLTSDPINGVIEVAPFPIGSGRDGRGRPRFLKVNTFAGAQTDWTVTITLMTDAESEELTSTSFTVTLPAGAKSIVTSVPFMGLHAEWAKIKIENNTAGGVGRFRSLVLYVVTRNDFRGPRS